MPKEENRKEHIMDEEPIDFFLGDPRKWLVAITVLLALLGAIGGYYIHALKSVRMEGMSITEINTDNEETIALQGEIRLYNPSALPLDIEGIDYEITIEERLVGAGKIYGDRIPAGKRATMLFEQDIGLSRSVSEEILLADKDWASVMMRGTITMVFLGVRIKLPFREEQDIKPLIESKITAIAARHKETAKNIVGRTLPYP